MFTERRGKDIDLVGSRGGVSRVLSIRGTASFTVASIRWPPPNSCRSFTKEPAALSCDGAINGPQPASWATKRLAVNALR